MAELKWTNVNDAGANAAMSNYLDANKAFRKSVMGIGDTLSDFSTILRDGDADVNRTLRDRNTNLLLNRMAQIETPEAYNEFVKSGATNGTNLDNQFGWFIDMDKVNTARGNLAKNVFDRANNIEKTHDYSEGVRELDSQIANALANGDVKTYHEALKKRTVLGSSDTNFKRAEIAYNLNKDVFDIKQKGNAALNEIQLAKADNATALSQVEAQAQALEERYGNLDRNDPNNKHLTKYFQALDDARKLVNQYKSKSDLLNNQEKRVIHDYGLEVKIYNPNFNNQPTTPTFGSDTKVPQSNTPQLHQPVQQNTTTNVFNTTGLTKVAGDVASQVINRANAQTPYEVQAPTKRDVFDESVASQTKDKSLEKNTIGAAMNILGNASQSVKQAEIDKLTQANQVGNVLRTNKKVMENYDKAMKSGDVNSFYKSLEDLPEEEAVQVAEMFSASGVNIDGLMKNIKTTDGEKAYNSFNNSINSAKTEAIQSTIAQIVNVNGLGKNSISPVGQALLDNAPITFGDQTLLNRSLSLDNDGDVALISNQIGLVEQYLAEDLSRQGVWDNTSWMGTGEHQKIIEDAITNGVPPDILAKSMKHLYAMQPKDEISTSDLRSMVKVLKGLGRQTEETRNSLINRVQSINDIFNSPVTKLKIYDEGLKQNIFSKTSGKVSGTTIGNLLKKTGYNMDYFLDTAGYESTRVSKSNLDTALKEVDKFYNKKFEKFSKSKGMNQNYNRYPYALNYQAINDRSLIHEQFKEYLKNINFESEPDKGEAILNALKVIHRSGNQKAITRVRTLFE